MKTLKSLRKDIDLIHTNIFRLVIKRIQITEKIVKIKSKEKMKLTDLKREMDLIHMFDKKLKSDSELKIMMQKIQKIILTENKKYLKKRQNEKN
jgi:chorismate mutase